MVTNVYCTLRVCVYSALFCLRGWSARSTERECVIPRVGHFAFCRSYLETAPRGEKERKEYFHSSISLWTGQVPQEASYLCLWWGLFVLPRLTRPLLIVAKQHSPFSFTSAAIANRPQSLFCLEYHALSLSYKSPIRFSYLFCSVLDSGISFSRPCF